MKSHQLTTDLKYTYSENTNKAQGNFWTIYKNDQLFAQIIAPEAIVQKIVYFLNNDLKED
jgi:hypothetical protein